MCTFHGLRKKTKVLGPLVMLTSWEVWKDGNSHVFCYVVSMPSTVLNNISHFTKLYCKSYLASMQRRGYSLLLIFFSYIVLKEEGNLVQNEFNSPSGQTTFSTITIP